jgi:hypothetical protein
LNTQMIEIGTRRIATPTNGRERPELAPQELRKHTTGRAVVRTGEGSMRHTRLAVCMACAVFLTMAAPARADRTSGPADARGEIGAEAWPDEQGTSDELDENGPEGDYDADGDDRAIGAAGPFVSRTAPRGDNGAPTAHVDSGHARAPPASLSAPRTGPGA